MSRDPYRSSFNGGERWDTERFTLERDRNRVGIERERYEERDSRFTRGSGVGRTRERSVDEIYERRRPLDGYEEDRYERREYYDDEPRFAREKIRERGPSITIEKEREREIYNPSPPPVRRAPVRPGIIRRQSSLDTFDRRPLARLEREEYGPPARYYRDQAPLPPLTPIPLPRTRALPPPRRYAERDYYDEIKVADPDFYGDDDFRGYPERIREREIIRKRRSRSRESRKSKSVKSSVRSSSAGSASSSSSGTETVRSEFPKKGKTRMPARLVSKEAIRDLGYDFEQEGDIVIIQKALGRENIDEVIKLSEDYKSNEKSETGSTTGGTIYEERRQEVITTPANNTEVVTDTKIIRRASPSPARSHRSHHNAVIVEARPREESTFVERKTTETIERSAEIPIGPLALAIPEHRNRVKDERAIRAEIKALEAEKEALRAERKAEKEMRRADRIRQQGRASEGDLVLYERERVEYPEEEVTLVRRERVVEPEGGVRIEKDKKGPPPRLVRAMLATLT